MERVARPCRSRPRQRAATSNNSPGKGKSVDHQPHADRRRVPATGRKRAEQGILGARIAEVEGLRIVAAGEFNDLIPLKPVAFTGEGLPDMEVVERKTFFVPELMVP